MLSKIKNLVKKFHNEEDAPTMVEYGLMVALVAVACIVAIGAMSGGIQTIFTNIGTTLTTAN